MHALIIKENIKEAELIKLSLLDKAFQCTICTDGISAMAYMNKFKPNIILLDQLLPDIQGLDLAKWILHLYNPYVVLMTNDLTVDQLKLTGEIKYIDTLLNTPIDLKTLKPGLLAKAPKSQDYKTPRYFKSSNLDKEALIGIIGKTLESVSVDLKVKDKDFLASALGLYMKDHKGPVYRELASKYGMFNKYSAYMRMRRIKNKINGRMKNMNVLEELSSEVLKKCEQQY